MIIIQQETICHKTIAYEYLNLLYNTKIFVDGKMLEEPVPEYYYHENEYRKIYSIFQTNIQDCPNRVDIFLLANKDEINPNLSKIIRKYISEIYNENKEFFKDLNLKNPYIVDDQTLIYSKNLKYELYTGPELLPISVSLKPNLILGNVDEMNENSIIVYDCKKMLKTEQRITNIHHPLTLDMLTNPLGLVDENLYLCDFAGINDIDKYLIIYYQSDYLKKNRIKILSELINNRKSFSKTPKPNKLPKIYNQGGIYNFIDNNSVSYVNRIGKGMWRRTLKKLLANEELITAQTVSYDKNNIPECFITGVPLSDLCYVINIDATFNILITYNMNLAVIIALIKNYFPTVGLSISTTKMDRNKLRTISNKIPDKIIRKFLHNIVYSKIKDKLITSADLTHFIEADDELSPEMPMIKIKSNYNCIRLSNFYDKTTNSYNKIYYI